jgi:hypothetical protein
MSAESTPRRWKNYTNRLIAKEVSRTSKYFDRLIQFAPRSGDEGWLFKFVDAPLKSVCNSLAEMPDLSEEREHRTAILFNGNFNHQYDIQETLQHLRPRLSRTSRLLVIAYNPYLRWLYRLANKVGVRRGEMPTTFITRTDIDNLAKISGYELVRARPVVYCPFELGGVGTLVNLSLAALPCVRWLGFATVLIMRPLKAEALSRRPSLSVVIPARNEKGNIENAVSRLQAFPADLEIIFVEGHSNDSTWEEIQRVIETYSGPHRLKALRQTGKGKNDAVRLGLSQANGELLTILDADLTMPPELISRFYEAYCLGLADFVNGTRLVYPMEGQAMRFLNLLGNIAFAKALSFVLDIAIGDSLCGTKLLARHDYERAVRWRKDFGDFDPFGDFELIFPAAMLGLGIIDIPIRYQARTYGTTQIHRFRHGLMLLKMTLIGLVKIRMGSR